MTSIDPSSAIWGYGFGRIVSKIHIHHMTHLEQTTLLHTDVYSLNINTLKPVIVQYKYYETIFNSLTEFKHS